MGFPTNRAADHDHIVPDVDVSENLSKRHREDGLQGQSQEVITLLSQMDRLQTEHLVERSTLYARIQDLMAQNGELIVLIRRLEDERLQLATSTSPSSSFSSYSSKRAPLPSRHPRLVRPPPRSSKTTRSRSPKVASPSPPSAELDAFHLGEESVKRTCNAGTGCTGFIPSLDLSYSRESTEVRRSKRSRFPRCLC